MALVAAGGTPPWIAGGVNSGHIFTGAGGFAIILDAANESAILIAEIETSDGGSHTIDTTGSSSFGWRTGSGVIFANAGTTVKVGIAAVDMANGPPGRAVNVADVVTYDVSKSLVGGDGGITTAAWQEHVPDTGTKTITNGDPVAFAIQMTTRVGADSVASGAGLAPLLIAATPTVTSFLGGVYAAVNGLPNFVITFSDGARGYPRGGLVVSNLGTAQAWNNASVTKEYGNLVQFPFPGKVYGIVSAMVVGADLDLILYSDPLGTPVAEITRSIDSHAVASIAGTRLVTTMFPTPYTFAANQPLAVIAKPTTATNITMTYFGFDIAAHQFSQPLGENCYAINRNTGAFAAQNSSKDRFAIGLLVGGADDGASAGGGFPASRVRAGM